MSPGHPFVQDNKCAKNDGVVSKKKTQTPA